MHSPLYAMRLTALRDSLALVKDLLSEEGKSVPGILTSKGIFGTSSEKPLFEAILSEARYNADWLLEGQPTDPNEMTVVGPQTILNLSGTFETKMEGDTMSVLLGRHSRRDNRQWEPAPDCPVEHHYADEDWRPTPHAAVHEHLVKSEKTSGEDEVETDVKSCSVCGSTTNDHDGHLHEIAERKEREAQYQDDNGPTAVDLVDGEWCKDQRCTIEHRISTFCEIAEEEK